MKLFLSYLKIHIKSILMFSVFTGVFIVVFALAGIPLAPVLYACVICFVIALIITGVSFAGFYERHKIFSALENDISVSIDNLPAPGNQSEEDYTNLIKALFAEKCRVTSEKDMSIAESADYYTLWAHQIKTPIAAMKLLLSEDETEKYEQLFRIEQYVNMALQYARAEQGGSDYVIHECEIDGIVRQAIRKFAKTFILRKISLCYNGISYKAVTDDKWLLFCIEQILSNSLKYTNEEGEVSIYISGNELVIADNGIGIAQEDLPRICEKGFTGYNGRTDKKSTGIGLYLCKKILTRLGHGIRLESAVGEGTRVFIKLECNRVYE